jgi:hypothetical protein
MQHCPFCHHPLRLVHVHGHYQCTVCGTNALPCCDGDNCDTNLLLGAQQPVSALHPQKDSKAVLIPLANDR